MDRQANRSTEQGKPANMLLIRNSASEARHRISSFVTPPTPKMPCTPPGLSLCHFYCIPSATRSRAVQPHRPWGTQSTARGSKQQAGHMWCSMEKKKMKTIRAHSWSLPDHTVIFAVCCERQLSQLQRHPSPTWPGKVQPPVTPPTAQQPNKT